MATTLAPVAALPDKLVVGDPLTGHGGALTTDGTVGSADVRFGPPIGELGSQRVDLLDRTVELGREAGLRGRAQR